MQVSTELRDSALNEYVVGGLNVAENLPLSPATQKLCLLKTVNDRSARTPLQAHPHNRKDGR